MNIAYLNAYDDGKSTAGGAAHVRQFVTNMSQLGHQLWTLGGITHPHAHTFSQKKHEQVRQLRSLSCYYHRIEDCIPWSFKWAQHPLRRIAARRPHVFEWNTVPEFAAETKSQPVNLSKLRRAAADITLNICVSEALAFRIRDLGYSNIQVVPNGSDPNLFTPAAAPCERMARFTRHVNVCWVGSGDIRWHNVPLLIAAAKALYLRGNTTLAFHLIGYGVRDLDDAPPNLHYHGAVSYENLPHWLSAMHIGVLAYHDGAANYGSPLKLFDYMAAGLTVVSTPQRQTETILASVRQEHCVLKHVEATRLADLLEHLSASDFRSMGLALRAKLVADFTWRHNAQRIIEHLQALH